MRSLLAVLNVLGSLIALFAIYFLPPAIVAVIYDEAAVRDFLAAGILTGVIGLLLRLATTRYRAELKPRDGYLLVTLSWLIIAAIATIPLLMQLPALSFTDAMFESVSGLSTTGSTILSGIDTLPYSINYWRHSLHWLGGMGIIVLAVAVLPLLGVGGMQIYRAETPGPVKDSKLTPRITETAKLLWLVYAGITAVCVVTLWAAGMSVFDAICHGFSVAALGGFSTHDASIGWFATQPVNAALIESILVVFMLLASVNFATHFLAVRRADLGAYRRDPEARRTWAIMLGSAVLISLYLLATGTYSTAVEAFRHGTFAVVSVASTTGFVTEDYGQWPVFAPMWMLFLSSVACATGSTGGGIKMFRTLVLIKQSLREMFTLIHPQAVMPLKVARNVIPNRVVYSVLAFIFLYFMTVVAITLALLASGLDFTSAFSATLASINNAGPGLNIVGPSTNYAVLTNTQTWLCTAAMFLGRIEILTVLVLFTPAFWRK